ncbi:Sapep family Mn(2+)-dependent dipeptidase [Gordonibacter massiliensis (ex Traore et al. 2017)]|uniref:Sapep family Mn(2+)-dependent dipeptidase n=1 Tax=Gordonibacter massiliensis (ex Traore et al. 2017) TaxID=1841863 RepID=UPI001C8BCE4E|nr:Sapep family Mn(2+)-dependent dipeptidase [Gordonibacter massiliensis (ex Traore et al. 2017)]MBX9032430.1 M20 family metallopeptidase [Gordonibacter massiliensis (ex Traore et al. 2017)]
MEHEELTKKIDAYLDDNWDAMVEDIATLVRIPSFQEDDKKADGAPFGPGPKAALTAALKMAEDMGFSTHDAEGYIGFADFPGKSDTQIGIIGHMDVVPAGPGWNFEPYDVTRKDGYLVGRGTLDDKGPSVMALHAMKFWKDQGVEFPYTIRFLFGANEESGMADVAYYHEHYDDPAFLFTPDAEFPVCYGEKGGYDGMLMSKPIEPCARVVVEFEGGMATNAVPGLAHAIVNADAKELPNTDRIVVTEAGPGRARLDATGKSAHASTPDEGVNAIGLIVDYLLEHGLCGADERAFFELDQKLLNHTDGSGLGIKSADEYFGPLTVVGGTIKLEDDRFVQTLDSRFPTSITADEITERVREQAAAIGGSFENTLLMEPFLVKPDSPVIQALLNAYNEATGEQAEPFTMGGGTYAREFKSGASFGPEKPWIKDPEWVGMMHGPDEGVSEDLLKQSFKIYALTIDKLMGLDLK